ncbi:MAG: flagellar motor protein MotB [Alphaproteobacteria bacterium]
MSKKKASGAPLWMVTFADLMSLLLTLFVLMLTFAKLDADKYQQIAGNMREAFGIQYIKKLAGVIEEGGGPAGIAARSKVPKVVQELKIDDILGATPPGEADDIEIEETLGDRVKKVIADQIAQSMANVEERADEVVVRFPAKIAFPPGIETLTTEFLVALNNLAVVIEQTEGEVIIAGHTDDRPIRTAQFRSNWDLSTARANSVIHYLLELTTIDASRLSAMGYADSRPLLPNTSEENRAANRRVEIIIRKKQK